MRDGKDVTTEYSHTMLVKAYMTQNLREQFVNTTKIKKNVHPATLLLGLSLPKRLTWVHRDVCEDVYYLVYNRRHF